MLVGLRIKTLMILPLILLLAVAPLFEASLHIAQAQSLTDGEYNPETDPDDEGETYLTEEGAQLPADQAIGAVLSELEWATAEEKRLIISPQDMNKIRNYEVDVRVTNYLLSLVRPVEQGGYGFTHIKAARIFKNYDSQGTGRFDRETLAALQEEGGLESVHHRGLAADISEVGEVTCKLVERRHLGGDKTRWQRPKPVKVAWQSKDGISRHPTPKGPSLVEISGTMSAESILRMLNESGEMDEYAEFVHGLDLPTIFQYVGANILLKTLGSTKITTDPLADSLLRIIGASALQKAIPGLPEGMALGHNEDDLRVVIAKEWLSERLGLPPGSIRGKGWEEIVRDVGQRALEQALGLPALFLKTHSLDEASRAATVRAALEHFAKSDEAFNFFPGTIEKIKRGDEAGIRMAGIKILADVLRLTNEQRRAFEEAAKSGGVPKVDPTTFAVDKSVPIVTLAGLLTTNEKDQNEAIEALKNLGLELLSEAATKFIPSRFEGVTRQLLQELLNPGSKVTFGELKETIGAGKLAAASGLEVADGDTLIAGRSSRVLNTIAQFLNRELGLSGSSAVNADDVRQSTGTGNFSLISKVGGAQVDKAIGWAPGTGLALIKREKGLEEALQEVFANALGVTLGLPSGTVFSLRGDLSLNYGSALIATRLGAQPGQLEGKKVASDFSESELRQLFGSTPEAWTRTDVRLGVSAGSTEEFLKGSLSFEGLARRVSQANLANVTAENLWNYFDLEDRFRLSRDETVTLLKTIAAWDKADLEKREAAFQLALQLISQSLDERTGFTKGSFMAFIRDPGDGKIAERLLREGIRLLAAVIGINLEGFDEGELRTLTARLTAAFDGNLNPFEREFLIRDLLQATGIPEAYRDDVANFLSGDYRVALERWSAAMWVEFAEKYLPEGVSLSYEELRRSLDLDDATLINTEALQLYNEATGGNLSLNQFLGLPAEQRQSYLDQARRLLMQRFRDEAQYKIADAFLNQSLSEQGIILPANFAKTMLEGDVRARLEMLESFVFTNLDRVLGDLSSSYESGTLKRIFRGEITNSDIINFVRTLVGRTDADFGVFDGDFVKTFFTYVTAPKAVNIYSDERFRSMWQYLDGWFARYTGISGLPVGFSKSVYLAAANSWDLGAEIKEGEQLIVPSLESLGEAFLVSRLTTWADRAFGLPAGSVFRLYQATTRVIAASRALAAARAAAPALNAFVEGISGVAGAGEAAAVQAQTALRQAQAELTALAITIALNACSACQQFFASVDKALAAPPGFTNMAVAGAIGMALGLGPAGLIVAAVYYLFGTYRVDYLCPIPPPDRFALASFDNDYDSLDYPWGSYYADSTRPVKDSPKPGTEFFGKFGENPFDWDEGVPFSDGNDPELWMAWSRYFTGRLLDNSLAFGESQVLRDKPRQIITYRQANVEFFASRARSAFGEYEANNPRVGLGYSQKSTKTTDYVHVSYGGLF